MPRIVYYGFPTGRIQGGMKMILRHVETLRDLGFDAVFATTPEAVMPEWLDHRAPVHRAFPVLRGDILVIPEDASNALGQAMRRDPSRTVVFTQNQYIFSAFAVEALAAFAETPRFMAVGRILAGVVGRAFPTAEVELVPCFADERLFGPASERTPAIAYVPKKRALEPKVISAYFKRLYPRHAGRPWREVADLREPEVAGVLAASEIYLSLSRFESVGMATLEAMASGCVCAGFTGIGGREYATAANGFWVPEDDCEAAVDALARAADLVLTGGPPLARYREAAQATARQWSYARFREALEETWMRLAPEVRIKDGPLD
ncbi:glycosyltransferase [Phenylobacterium kunshanense]|uniref:Glycosyl transferase family 1 domain-containing protein n=1 Tax=Phenylobacterium kunshanense TaxID=1445034 RepID=A0A328BK57_9CAUL|nr:glycosyltransferase [Phenylobacterium kunshanense]RAK66314.1 hypothetical protein DJ019_08660 [Phenylobacterium kunshanense]